MENSLVMVRDGAGLDRRHETLEPIAEHARSLLRGDEKLRAHRAHASACRQFVEAVAADYGGGEQVTSLRRIVGDEGNVLTAIDRCLDSGDGESAGRMTWALSPSWWLRRQASVGLPRAERCLKMAGSTGAGVR